MPALLMPKATAVWLVDNTALTFEQIAHFCALHHLEVKSIADGDSGQGIKGLDPILTGQLTRDAISAAESDPSKRLELLEPKVSVPEVKRKGPRYTPLSRRQDRPSAILWLVRNHGDLKDSQIVRLVGTTKPTIKAIRERTHWNISQLQPLDPVTLGICSQVDLDSEVEKAALANPPAQESDDSLLPASSTQSPEESAPEDTDAAASTDAAPAAESDSKEVFKNFSSDDAPAEDPPAAGADAAKE